MKYALLLLVTIPFVVWSKKHSERGRRHLNERKGKYDKDDENIAPTPFPSQMYPIYAPVNSVPTYPVPGPTYSPVRRPTSSPTQVPDILPTVDDRQDDGEAKGSPTGSVPVTTSEPTPTTPVSDSPVNSPTDSPVESPTLMTVGPVSLPFIPTGEPTNTETLSPTSFIAIPTTTTATTTSPMAPTMGDSIGCEDDALKVLWQGLGPPFSSDPIFRDLNSYQCQALHRVQQQVGYESFDFQTTMKYWILYCVYFATNSEPAIGRDNIFARQAETPTGWKNTRGWLENNLHPCDGWYGIRCDSEAKVTEIRLARNGLSGIFPREVVYLASSGIRTTGAGRLERLDLQHNPNLTNDLDDIWISELGDAMKIIRYGWTAFQGPLPRLPSNIQEYDASYTNHTGPFPDTFFDELDELKILILDGISYGSVIPSDIASLPNLEIFYIREANVQGDLSYLEGSTSLVELLIDGNQGLTGPLYSFLGDMDKLRSFSAIDCSLSGSIPTELGQLTGLVQLWLQGNSLTGPIPSQLGNIDGLRILALEDTDLRGSVPLEVCLNRFSGDLTSMSVDCFEEVDCTGFFPNCCSCCSRNECGS